MAAYSMDLRQRVLADCDAGVKTKPVAEKYGVSRTWVRWLQQRRRETGNIAPGHSPGRPRKIDRVKRQQLVADDPDATLVELRDRLGVVCVPTAIWLALAALKITFKKSAAGRRAGPARRRRTPRDLAGVAARARPAPARVPRRNVGYDPHDPAAGPGGAGAARSGRRAARPREDDHADRGPGLHRPALCDGAGWRGQSAGV